MLPKSFNPWVLYPKRWSLSDFDWYLFHGHAAYPINAESDEATRAQTWLTRNLFNEPGVRMPAYGLIVTESVAAALRPVTTARFLAPQQQGLYYLPFEYGSSPRLWRDLDVLNMMDVFRFMDRRFLPAPPMPPAEDVWICESAAPGEQPQDWIPMEVPRPAEEGDEATCSRYVPLSQATLDRHGVMQHVACFLSDTVEEVLRPHLPIRYFHVVRLQSLLRSRRRRQ